MASENLDPWALLEGKEPEKSPDPWALLGKGGENLRPEGDNWLDRLGQAAGHSAVRQTLSPADMLGTVMERFGADPASGSVMGNVAAKLRGGAYAAQTGFPGPEGGAQGTAEQVAEGVGSVVPSLLAGLATGGAPAIARIAGMYAVSGAQEGMGAWYEAMDATGDEDKAWTAMLATGGLGGALEVVGVERLVGMFKRIDKGSGGRFKRALLGLVGLGKTGAVEGGTEFSQDIVSDIVAKHISKHDEDREIGKTALQSGKVGFLTGVLLGGAGKAVSYGLVRPEEFAPQEEGAADAQRTDGGRSADGSSVTPVSPEGEKSAPDSPGEAVSGESSVTPVSLTPESADAQRTLGPLARFRDRALAAVDRQEAEGTATPEQAQAKRETLQAATTREAKTPEERLVQERAQARGIPLEFAEGIREAGFEGGYLQDGGILLAPQEDESVLRQYLYHEMSHGLMHRNPEAAESLIAQIEAVDPEGFKAAFGESQEIQGQAGVELSPEAARDEQLAQYTEGLSRWLDGVFQDEARFQGILRNDRTLGQKIVDAIVKALRALGIDVADTRARRIQALADEVYAGLEPGQVPDPETSMRLALASKEAFDTLLVQGAQAQASPTSPTQSQEVPRDLPPPPVPPAEGTAAEDPRFATGHRGTFDPSSPDIRFAAADKSMGGPLARSKSDRFIEAMVQHLRPAERMIELSDSPVDDMLNFVLREKLRRGTSRDRIDKLRAEWERPILEQIRSLRPALGVMDEASEIAGGWHEGKQGVTDLANLYLYGRHAPHRNEVARRRNEVDMGDGVTVSPFGHEENPGSGMRTSKAEAVVDFLEQGQYGEQFKQLGQMWDAFTENNLQTMVADGLITEEHAEAMREAFPHYVPMRADLQEEDTSVLGGAASPGRGVDLRGREFKPALGRSTLGQDPIAYGFAQAEMAIVRGEKRQVGQRLWDFIEENEERLADVVELDPEFKTKTLSKAGKAQGTTDIEAIRGDGVLGVKMDGETRYMEFKGDAARVATALRGLGPEMSSVFVRYPRMATSWLSAVSTRYNPAFTPFNAIRDVATAFFNSLEIGTAFAMNVVRPDNISRSFRTILALNWEQQAAIEGRELNPYQRYMVSRITPKQRDLMERWRAAGGPVSILDLRSLEQQVGEITKFAQDADKTQAGLKRFVLMFPRMFENVNEAVENMVRLSAFEQVVETGGATDEQAALFSKELTVNFEQKGRVSPFLNAYWAFSVAGINGTHRALGAVIRSRRVQAMVLGMMGFAAAWEWLARMLMGTAPSGDDWWDLIPEYEKKDHFIIPTFWDGKQDGGRVTIPLPFVFRFFWNVGRKAGSMMDPASKEDPIDAAFSLMASALDEFNPFGGAAQPLEVLSPTLLDPVVQIATNKDWAGRQIMPDDYGSGKPLSERYFPDSNPHLVEFAKWANSITGGDKITPGEIDRLGLNSPEIYELLLRFPFGGLGATLERTWGISQRAVSGAEIPSTEIPILRRLRREASPYWTDKTFRNHTDLIDQVKRQVRAAEEEGDRGRARQLRAQNRRLLALEGQAKGLQRELKRLREQEDDPEIRARMEEKMTTFNRKALEAQISDGKR